MKLTAILLFLFCMQVAARSGAQTVTISVKNAPLKEVFRQIQKQTGMNIMVKQSLLDKAGKVSITVTNMPVNEVLKLCFANLPLDYEIEGNTITIIAKSENKQVPNDEGGVPPPIDITGKVTDTDGNPLSGATVKVRGTSKGTTTNNDGVFVLKAVDEDATLEISFVGFETYTVSVNNKTTIVASLTVKPENLNEVVINKGYYTEKQRFSVSNVGKITAKDIEKQPVNNPLFALQGHVTGVFIEQATGLPGSGVKIRIQGQNSISKGNDPLYVIDGVPYAAQNLPNLGDILGNSGSSPGLVNNNGNPLNYINPGDIESITILKDADATAIYGSRAANGAVIITTKRGKVQNTRVDIDAQTGWGTPASRMDVLNLQQYLQMRHEAINNDGQQINSWDSDINGFWDSTRSTNWQKVLIGNKAKYSEINTTITGGNNSTQYSVGGTFHKETTVFPGDLGDKKVTLRFNINNVSANQKFFVAASAFYMSDNNNLISTDLTSYAVRLAPNAPNLYNSDGSLNWMNDASNFNTWNNPLASFFNKYISNTSNLLGNGVIGYHITNEITLKSSFGYTEQNVNEIRTGSLLALAPWIRPYLSRAATYVDNTAKSSIIEPQLDYVLNRKLFRINLLAGFTYQESKSNAQQLLGLGYNSEDVLEDIKSASSVTVDRTLSTQYKYSAIFGRANYVLLDKYIVNLSARRDGSSRFGVQNQFHNFAAAGLGWLFSNERFFEKNLKFISTGKLRVNYGTSGNDQIGDYAYLNLYNPTNASVPYQGATGLLPNGLPNPYLQWEETKKLQGGIDLGILNDKILLNVNYYSNRSSNQLLGYSLPIITGFNTIASNFPATVKNYGWEFSFNSANITRAKFNWTTSINVTIPKNKLVSFPNLNSSSYANSLFIGEPVNVQLAYHLLRVDPNTGIYQFADKDGRITQDPDFSKDRVVHINPNPKFYGGLQNSITYQGLQFDIFLQFVKQDGPNYLFGNFPGDINGGQGNQPTSVLDRWQKIGDKALIQKYNSDWSLSSNFSSVQNSDAAFSDASYVRVKNLSLSYQVKTSWVKKVHLQSFRVYAHAQNLFTFTNYKGLDPETKSSATLPPLKVITFGLQLSL